MINNPPRSVCGSTCSLRPSSLNPSPYPVLKGIENVRSRTTKRSEQAVRIQKLIDAHMSTRGLDPAEAKRRDEVGHHVLRLAYCQSKDKRDWFVRQELELFRCVCACV